MKSKPSRLLVRILKITGISIAAILLLLFLLPYLFPGFVSGKIRQWAHKSIRTELNFSSARLSFFRHFPALTLTLYDVKLKGSAPFENETLIDAREISLGVDLRSIFSEVDIDKIYLENAFINIQADTAGHANYNIYISKPAKTPTQPADSAGASLKIQKIIIENSKVVYDDRSLPMLIHARGFNYQGSGDLSKDVFDLNTHMQVDSIDFYYDKVPYFVSKKLNADLITSINTNSLAFIFQKNDLLINQLPVAFTGRLAFLKEGYDMDFKLKSESDKSDLHDMFSALPPNMVSWLSKTEVKGYGNIEASLTGKYIASSNTMPDLIFNMKVRNGYISNNKAPVPVSNLFLNFQSRLPGLNTDSLHVDIDSIYFNLDKDYFSAILNVKGLKAPWISAKVNAALDLSKLDNAFGIAPVDLKGSFNLHLQADGQYATRIVRKTTVRKTILDTVISSIPRFSFTSSLHNGYFKFTSLPEAISGISFDMNAACGDNNYKDAHLAIDNINANVLTSYIKGFFHIGRPGDTPPTHTPPAATPSGDTPSGATPSAAGFPIDAGLVTVFHLSDIKKVYPLDSMDLAGDLSVHIKTKGNYQPDKHQFPVTRADLQLSNGRVKTKYYPDPLENIQVSALVTNTDGSIKDLDVALTPISFFFEGQPFMVRADLKDFTDLRYNIMSRGTLDIGKISRVLNIKGYDVRGLIETHLSLRGRESDATTGHYDRLLNEGSMKMKELQVGSELFPLPFLIHTGLFRFDQDKMWFDAFNASYGKSHFTLNGWLSDVIGYMTKKGEPLHGNFDLKSDYVVVDQLMAFAGPATPTTAATQTGVIIIPADLAIGFHADIKKILYSGLEIDSFKGGVSMDSGAVHLDTTTFILVGAPIEMNASYQSQSPRSATFDYHLRAREFDVHRAYTQVKLFRDLASSAGKAQGIISLDYHLSGRLDGNMHPIYPSLKGGGELDLSKVKVKGLRMFGEVSKETNKDVNDPDLSKVVVKSTINNNIITIQRTRMKVSAFKLRIEGQSSFDGRLNLHVRVGLPPFGIIGIPVTVIGTEDKPIVKVRRSKKGDVLEETEEKDEENQ
jgi:AsmA protein